MKTIGKIIAFISALGIASCFDAIMNHSMTTSFQGNDGFNTIIRWLTYIGRFAVGYFIIYKVVYPFIKTELNGDENQQSNNSGK